MRCALLSQLVLQGSQLLLVMLSQVPVRLLCATRNLVISMTEQLVLTTGVDNTTTGSCLHKGPQMFEVLDNTRSVESDQRRVRTLAM